MDEPASYLAAYLLVIPVTAALGLVIVASCILLAVLTGLIVRLVYHAFNPSHPISPHEEID